MGKMKRFKLLLFMFYFLTGTLNLFSQESICKLQVGGVTTAMPIVTGEKFYTIKVYMPNADKITSAEVDAASIEANINQQLLYKDNVNPCQSYLTINLTIDVTRPLGIRQITLYKLNNAGGRVIAGTFNFEVRPGFLVNSAIVRDLDNHRPVSFYIGRKYKLTLTGERLLMMQMETDPTIQIKVLRELTPPAQNERNFEIVFKEIFYGSCGNTVPTFSFCKCISLPVIGDGKGQGSSFPLNLILRPYSVFDVKYENWTSGPFFGSKLNTFADINGDGKADALIVNSSDIRVGRSNGVIFSSNEQWLNGVFVERSLHVADVTGDGKADFIAVLNSQVIVFKAMPGGFSKFGTKENWTENAYYGDRGTFFADVTGDGKADAIVVNNGNIVVRRSTGNSFSANENWTENPYYGDRGTFFADVTGDGKADAIVVNDWGITVRRSTGNAFSANENWTTDPFFGTRGTFFGDIDGDGKSDAIAVNNDGVKIRRSGGTSFAGILCGINEPFYGEAGTFFADVDGDGKVEAIAANYSGIFIRKPLIFFF